MCAVRCRSVLVGRRLLILMSRAKRLRACAVVCSDQAGNALKVPFHIFRVFREPVSDDLVLLVRPVLDGGVETTTAWAERAVLGDNGAVGRCLEAKTPRCGRAPATFNLPFDVLLRLEDGKRAFAGPITDMGMFIRASEPCTHRWSRRTVEPLCAFEFGGEARWKVDIAQQCPKNFGRSWDGS